MHNAQLNFSIFNFHSKSLILLFFTFDYVQTPHVRHIPSKLGLCTLLIGVFTFHFSFAEGAIFHFSLFTFHFQLKISNFQLNHHPLAPPPPPPPPEEPPPLLPESQSEEPDDDSGVDAVVTDLSIPDRKPGAKISDI